VGRERAKHLCPGAHGASIGEPVVPAMRGSDAGDVPASALALHGASVEVVRD